MIYQIKDDYYVKVGNKYTKLSFTLNGDELVMTPINSEKIEHNPNLIVNVVDYSKEKQKIIDKLKKSSKLFNKEDSFYEDKFFNKDKSFNRKKSMN